MAKKKAKRVVRRTPPKRAIPATGPLTLDQARAMVHTRRPMLAVRDKAAAVTKVPIAKLGVERKNFERANEAEIQRRVAEYKATMNLLKKRGVAAGDGKRGVAAANSITQPLQVIAEGDSWFDYPVPFFGGGIITRLERQLGVPVLNLAKAGDEVRFMLGVKERKVLSAQLAKGSPSGGPWDALLFSGGGNDLTDNPMALWIKDFDASIPAAAHLVQARFDAVLSLVRAGYEDLIAMRDSLTPSTVLIFHAYDFAIPDGRGVCGLGPWLKPTFDLRKFATQAAAFDVVKEMLRQFAAMMQAFANSHARVEFINTQNTLLPVPASWHNELHPARKGFENFATIFHTRLKALFPTKVF